MKSKIIIIDDDPQIRDMYRVTLGLQGYQVTVQEDGVKALEAMEKEKPDLALLDIMMPHLNGLDVLKTIKSNPKMRDIKVIMLSALSDDNTKEKAMKLGADSYLGKSEFSLSQVIEIVVKTLGESVA